MCGTCQAGSVPYSFSKLAVCVQDDMLPQLTSNKHIPGCVRYSSIDGKCLECAQGSFLYTDGNNAQWCMNRCPDNFVAAIDNLDGQAGICVSLDSDNTDKYPQCALM